MTHNKKIIGFTCGSFDILHTGHILMFEECKDNCDYLIVGLQSDPTIDRSGKNKPIQHIDERKIMLNSIKWIDEIVVYDTETDLYNILSNMINTNKLDVRIIGADWQDKEFTGYDLPIRVVYNSRDHKYSTSELRKRVFEAELKKLKT